MFTVNKSIVIRVYDWYGCAISKQLYMCGMHTQVYWAAVTVVFPLPCGPVFPLILPCTRIEKVVLLSGMIANM